MTRFNVFVLTLALAASLMGCASTDDVGVYTASLDERALEMVETHDAQGTIELELTYRDGASLERQTFTMLEGAPTPQAVHDFFSIIDADLIENFAPVAVEMAPAAERELVGPRIIDAQLENRARVQACNPERVGFADCLAVYTVAEGPQFLEMVEVRGEHGATLIELTHDDGEAVRNRVFEMPEGAPTPEVVLDFFRTIDPDLVEHLTPVAAEGARTLETTIERELVGPRILEADLQNRAMAPSCDPELAGFADCLRQG